MIDYFKAIDAPLAVGEDISDFIGIDVNKNAENQNVEGLEDDVKLKKVLSLWIDHIFIKYILSITSQVLVFRNHS